MGLSLFAHSKGIQKMSKHLATLEGKETWFDS